MDRYGMMQSLGFMFLMSLSMFILLNQHAALEWSLPSSMALTGAESTSSGLESLHLSLAGEGMRRRLQQVAADSTTNVTYIGYGVLAAGYVPCPPQTGRSYYTSNCGSATGPVNPYTRGCTTITSCARD